MTVGQPSPSECRADPPDIAEVLPEAEPQNTEIEIPPPIVPVGKPEEKKLITVYQHIIPTVGALVTFSMLGTLIRVQLNDLLSYPAAPIPALLWSQMVGCFIMGVATKLKGPLTYYGSPALFVGISTGLCGSITTFSSWQAEIFAEFYNTGRNPHNWFKNLLGGVSVIAVTLSVAIGADQFGRHLGTLAVQVMSARLRTCKRFDDGGDVRNRLLYPHALMDWAMVAAATVGLTAVAVVVGLVPSTRSVGWAILFGPAGAISRWLLSPLNSYVGKSGGLAGTLPAGTFAANWVGSSLLAIWWMLQNGAVVRPPAITCSILSGLADGLCGCLTTVSTFVVELKALPLQNSYWYFVASMVTAQAVWVLMPGIYFKRSGVDYPTCVLHS
ncbi:hypothetical protein EV182_000698 [Spiromyces aspiralis]|uniref:Uncharacterized protein n=1 Tax=Spiromyces aspiralis TaxID=68401 RepID=A0ACC1HP60_9FUNG|nr:hypothetical protein EV182_000698 [Spiromyces aspiralis]